MSYYEPIVEIFGDEENEEDNYPVVFIGYNGKHYKCRTAEGVYNTYIAQITNKSKRFKYERKFIVGKTPKPRAEKRKLESSYPIEVYLNGNKRYYQVTEDGLKEITEEKVYNAMYNQ